MKQRRLAKDKFRKKLWKDMANILFGKQCEDVRKHQDFEMTCSQSKIQRLSNRLLWDGHIKYTKSIKFNEHFYLIKKRKKVVKLNKNIMWLCYFRII